MADVATAPTRARYAGALVPGLVFAGSWILSAIVLVASGQGFPAAQAAIGAAYLALAAITVWMTEDAPYARLTSDRRRHWVQVAVIGVFIALTGWSGLVFHQVPGAGSVPGWSDLTGWLGSVGDDLFGNGNYLANPVTYFVLPMVLLLLLGARPQELGFGRGHRVGRVILVWMAIPVGFLVFAVATGQLTIARVVNRLVSNIMQNGPWEEFLFRGALQTRLRLLLTPEWAIVIQALLFGAWHLGLGYTNTGGAGLLPALASTLVHQAVIGLAFGIVYERTRNLLAPTVAHVLANSIG